MKILLVNKFLYSKGGDAISTLETGRLLSAKGHKVFYWGMKHPKNPEYLYSEYFVDNVDYAATLSIKKKMSNAFKILYSFEAKRKIEELVKIIEPDIVHLNNFAHQISPSILHVFKKYNIPTVMTMHDYKLVCASYSMLSNGKSCESCKNGRYHFCFRKKCVKDSWAKSLLNTVEMYLQHKILHLYNMIDIFIATSNFIKEKHIEMGFRGKIVCLPNFVNIGDFTPQYEWEERSIVYFGRLSPEKGLFTLLKAVKGLDIQLKIIGTGSMREVLERKVKNEKLGNIVFKGHMIGDDLKKEIKPSMATVISSEWYEAFGRTIIESFALGKPVIGARIGGIPELVKDSVTGYTFEAGNVDDLRSKIVKLSESKDKIVEMGKNARKYVEENFNQEKHYIKLMEIYSKAMRRY